MNVHSVGAPLSIGLFQACPTCPCLVVFSYARGAPPPLALARRPGGAGLPSAASLGPQALLLCSRAPTPTRSRSAARRRRASLRRLARAAGAPPMLAGPHPHSLSLGGPASPGFPPAPRSGRRRSSYARGAPPPLALARRPGVAGLPSGASLGPQALPSCPCHFHRVRIASRSNTATLISVNASQRTNSTTPITAMAPFVSQNDPVNCAIRTTVSGRTIRTPNCCAVRASLTRAEITTANCSETSAASGAG